MTQYKKEELEQKVKRLYTHPNDEIMRPALVQALGYLPKPDVDKLLNLSVIYIQGNKSRRFGREAIWGMSVIVLSREDITDEKYFIPTILHESAHEILNHTETNTIEEYIKKEDEAWSKVRDWLPKEFDELINDLEKEGGGTKGHESKKNK